MDVVFEFLMFPGITAEKKLVAPFRWQFVFRMRIMPAMICSAIVQDCFSVNSSGELKFLVTFIHSFS
jgi:hypothetical protein